MDYPSGATFTEMFRKFLFQKNGQTKKDVSDKSVNERTFTPVKLNIQELLFLVRKRLYKNEELLGLIEKEDLRKGRKSSKIVDKNGR